MAKVVIQLLDDNGDLRAESTVIDDATVPEAERVMEAAVDAAGGPCQGRRRYIVEFHYLDGDVGAYEDTGAGRLWAGFTRSHEQSHIVIRPDSDQGQQLSNRLHASARMATALNALVEAINATGGVVADGSGFVPAADDEWFDLGLAYIKACDALGLSPLFAEPSAR